MDRVRGALGRVSLDRVAYTIGAAIAALIVLGIVLVVFDANKDNFIVDVFTSVAEFFSAPFDDMFDLDDRDARIALNWGIGAFVYFILGVVVAGLIGRVRHRES